MSSPRPRTRQDPQTRRLTIVEASRQRFNQEGFAAASAAAIGRDAGSSGALVFHYFGTKADLYALVIGRELDSLIDAQRERIDSLPPSTHARARVDAFLDVILERLPDAPLLLGGGAEPAEAVAVRFAARDRATELLRGHLSVTEGWARHEIAVNSWLGFVEAACQDFSRAGSPADRCAPIKDAALGALEGALGDWSG